MQSLFHQAYISRFVRHWVGETRGRRNNSEIRTTTSTHEIFEHLFNKSFNGSGSVRESEFEAFYRESGILDHEESIKSNARELINNPF